MAALAPPRKRTPRYCNRRMTQTLLERDPDALVIERVWMDGCTMPCTLCSALSSASLTCFLLCKRSPATSYDRSRRFGQGVDQPLCPNRTSMPAAQHAQRRMSCAGRSSYIRRRLNEGELLPHTSIADQRMNSRHYLYNTHFQLLIDVLTIQSNLIQSNSIQSNPRSALPEKPCPKYVLLTPQYRQTVHAQRPRRRHLRMAPAPPAL
jgi:hypothetical protein